MTDENNYRFPAPSDPDLTINWLALKPGDYNKKTNLLEYTKRITEENTLKSPMPVGIGDYDSVVYVYPQGTIEVIGNVYCWNKRIRPGIYNAFEKLRFLDGNTVPEFDEEKITRSTNLHHASYNKKPWDNQHNPYSRIRVSEQEYIAEYRYVSFNNQITINSEEGIFPIPILDGRITLYPDGSFKTENMVVDSKDQELVDSHGYLGNHPFYRSLKMFYKNIHKTFDKQSGSFLQLYKHISDNEDGSVTYGAITENKSLTINRWIPIPKGIIPVNDGVVEINHQGMIKLSGLVISERGFKFRRQYFHVTELYQKSDNVLSINNELLDTSVQYYPIIDIIQDEETINNTNTHLINKAMIKDIRQGYRYHADNDTYQVIKYENGEVISVRFTAMRGWDNFRPDTEESKYHIVDDLFYLGGLMENDVRNIDALYYPFISRNKVIYGNGYLYPKSRFNPDGDIDVYLTLDHTLYYNHPEKSRGSNEINYLILNLNNEDYQPAEEIKNNPLITFNETDNIIQYAIDNDIILTRYDNKTLDKFVPYLTIMDERDNGTQPVSNYRIKNVNGDYYFNSRGTVIWKRDEEYFTLDTKPLDTSDNEVFYNTSWPDIETNELGHFKSLYTVDGYFTDEPIFIRKGHGQGYPWHDKNENNNTNEKLSPLNIDGIKRQETGLFKLVKRNVTHYLTKLEKQLIDNYKLPNVLTYIDDDFKLQRIEFIRVNESVTTENIEESIHLEYHAFRFGEIMPGLFDPANIYLWMEEENKQYLPFEYNRDQEKLYIRDTRLLHLPIKVVTGNLINGYDVFTYYNKHPYQRLNSHSVNQYLIDDKLTPYRLDNPESDVLYKGLKNLTLDDSGGYGTKPKFNVPDKHCLEDGPLYINLERGNINLKYLYWRTNESTLTYQGHVDVTGIQSGLFEINNIKLKQRTGFVDIWYDDPFNERSGYTIQRVKLLKERKLNDIIITEPEKFTRTTNKVKGESEPNSRILLSRKDNPNEILKETVSDNNGLWKINLNGIDLIDNGEYIVKQIDEWNNENQTTFIIEPMEYKEEDLLSVKELMGVQNYVYPINLRNKYNLSNVPHLVESKISYNIDEQTYTIHGIAANTLGQVYPEGTYKIGTSPFPYYSQVLSIKGKHFHPQIKEKDKEFYKLSNTESYLAKDILYEEKTHYNGEEIRNDLWIIPKTWIDDMEWVYNDYKRKNEDPNTSNKSDVEYHFNILSYLYPRFKNRKIYGSNLNIGRYQDKLIFDGWVELFIPITNSINPDNEDELTIFDSSYIALTVNHHISSVKAKGLPVRQHGINPCEDSFIKEGLSFREYYTHYFGVWNINNYLFFDPREINKHIKHKTDKNSLFVTKVKDIRQHISPVNPINRYIDVINYGDGNWEYIEGSIHKDVVLPNWLENNHQQYPLIFSNYNLSEIWEYDRNPSITNAIRFKITYGYTLNNNYNIISNSDKMKEIIYNHWVNRRFNPNLFIFDNETTGIVNYADDGNFVTITGKVKIGDRYTISNPQTVSNFDDIQYEEITPLPARTSYNYSHVNRLPNDAVYDNLRGVYTNRNGDDLNEQGNFIEFRKFYHLDNNAYLIPNKGDSIFTAGNGLLEFNFGYGFALRKDLYNDELFNNNLSVEYDYSISMDNVSSTRYHGKIVIYDGSQYNNFNYGDMVTSGPTVTPIENNPFYSYSKNYSHFYKTGVYKGGIVLILYSRELSAGHSRKIKDIITDFNIYFKYNNEIISTISREDMFNALIPNRHYLIELTNGNTITKSNGNFIDSSIKQNSDDII